MTVCYLEIDDEITGAIARLRAVRDGEAILVVPPGSRIATGRINFKLLAREAGERQLNLVAVSDEPSVRALAISAGVPAYDSLSSAEAALRNFREQDRELAERIGRSRARSLRKPARSDDKTQLMLTLPGAAPDTSATSGMREPERPADWVLPRKRLQAGEGPPRVVDSPAAGAARERIRRRRVGAMPIVAALVLVLLLAGVGYGAYLFLPTATITLQPSTSELRPAPFTIVADPNVAVVDATAGIVPAEWVEVPLTVSGQFSSTGVSTRETRATGIVRFRSENTVNDVPIVQGTVVSTGDGLQFETTEPAVVPRADFATNTRGQVDVPVRATRAGPSGNVAAGAISEVPGSLRALLVSARNPDPTQGGRRTELRVVSQDDYDNAVASLTAQAPGLLATRLGDPAAVPRGLTVFADTARVANLVAEPPATELVDTEAETFSVTSNGSAMVLGVNEALVDDVAESRLRTMLQPRQEILGGNVATTRSAGTVSGETVTFQASPSAQVFTQPDQAALVAGVRGKSIAEARRILSAYGMVDIAIWPEFVDRLPDQSARISLVVVTPSPQP